MLIYHHYPLTYDFVLFRRRVTTSPEPLKCTCMQAGEFQYGSSNDLESNKPLQLPTDVVLVCDSRVHSGETNRTLSACLHQELLA